jgi:hypothetical protein
LLQPFQETLLQQPLLLTTLLLLVVVLVVGISGNGEGGGGGAGGLRSTVTATGGGGSLESALVLDANTSYTVTVGAVVELVELASSNEWQQLCIFNYYLNRRWRWWIYWCYC